MTSRGPALLVHGGAGADPASGRADLGRGIRGAVAAGGAVLAQGGGAVAAVEAVVGAMEDNSRFNAGRGSALTTESTVKMDASIIEGDGLICIDRRGRLGGARTRPLMPVGFMSPAHDAPVLAF